MTTLSTFSIVAWDPNTDDLGIAVQSKFLAVGAVVSWARAGVGAVATQAWANTAYGPDGLALMKQGLTAQEALDRLVAADEDAAHRQVGMVDAQGNAATFTGAECLHWAGGRTGPGYACQGNILVSEETVVAMAEAFEATTDAPARGSAEDAAERTGERAGASSGGLWDRLVTALAAGQAAGGDSRGQQSAALLVVREKGGYGGRAVARQRRNDRFIDLRVDDHPAPIEELKRILELHKLYLFPSDPADLMLMDEKIVRELQLIAQRTGYYAGPISGVYDQVTREAMRTLIGVENLEERWREDDRIDHVVLEFLRDKFRNE